MNGWWRDWMTTVVVVLLVVAAVAITAALAVYLDIDLSQIDHQ